MRAEFIYRSPGKTRELRVVSKIKLTIIPLLSFHLALCFIHFFVTFIHGCSGNEVEIRQPGNVGDVGVRRQKI